MPDVQMNEKCPLRRKMYNSKAWLTYYCAGKPCGPSLGITIRFDRSTRRRRLRRPWPKPHVRSIPPLQEFQFARHRDVNLVQPRGIARSRDLALSRWHQTQVRSCRLQDTSSPLPLFRFPPRLATLTFVDLNNTAFCIQIQWYARRHFLLHFTSMNHRRRGRHRRRSIRIIPSYDKLFWSMKHIDARNGYFFTFAKATRPRNQSSVSQSFGAIVLFLLSPAIRAWSFII